MAEGEAGIIDRLIYHVENKDYTWHTRSCKDEDFRKNCYTSLCLALREVAKKEVKTKNLENLTRFMSDKMQEKFKVKSKGKWHCYIGKTATFGTRNPESSYLARLNIGDFTLCLVYVLCLPEMEKL